MNTTAQPPARWAFVALLAMGGVPIGTTQDAGTSSLPGSAIKGTVTVPGGRQMPEMVVYLERRGAKADAVPDVSTRAPGAPIVISQKEGKFVPSFVVVPVGGSVEFRNEETTDLEHNVVSRSNPKAFDLGLAGPKEIPLI